MYLMEALYGLPSGREQSGAAGKGKQPPGSVGIESKDSALEATA